MKYTALDRIPDEGVSHNPEIRKQVMLRGGDLPHLTNFSRSRFAPGQAAIPHSHADMVEVFFVESGAVAGSGQIQLSAKCDDTKAREELWVIGAKNRILVRENAPDIAELRTAHNLTLKWNWGWSWLWLTDTARFDLAEIGAVVLTLAKSCGIDEP